MSELQWSNHKQKMQRRFGEKEPSPDQVRFAVNIKLSDAPDPVQYRSNWDVSDSDSEYQKMKARKAQINAKFGAKFREMIEKKRFALMQERNPLFVEDAVEAE